MLSNCSNVLTESTLHQKSTIQIASFLKSGSCLYLVLLLVYRVALDANYVYTIMPKGYSFFSYVTPFGTNIVLSWILLLALVPFIVNNFHINHPSNYILELLYLIAFVPATSLMAYVPMPPTMLFLFWGYWLILGLLSLLLPTIRWSPSSFGIAGWCRIVADILLVCLFGHIVYVVLSHSGLHFSGFNEEAYLRRIWARGVKLGIVSRYLLTMTPAIFVASLGLYLRDKRRMMTLVVASGVVMLYGYNSTKAYIVALVAAFVAYYVYRCEKRILIVCGLTVLQIAAIVDDLYFSGINGHGLITNVIIRRVFFLPARLNYFYYDFFSANDKFTFCGGLLKNLFPSSYDKPAPFIIGEHYTNVIGCYANNGLFSDAYANMGIVGMMLGPILLVLVLRVFDLSTRGLSIRSLMGGIILVSYILIGSSITTALLSQGILLVCVFFYLAPRDERRG